MAQQKKRWIERSWQQYRARVIPKDAGQVQIDESRQAFFGGAAILFTALQMGMSDGPDVQPADERLLADLQAELDEFGQQLDAKVLKDRH